MESGADLATMLAALGWKQTDFAKRIGVHENTVSAWATGKVAVPGPVRAYLGLAVRIGEILK